MKISMPDRDIDMVFYPAEHDNAPLIIGFHGGGFLFGGSAMDDALWKENGEALGAAIASVEYRMGPEYRFPAAIEDAYDVLKYFYENGSEYGIDPDRISVMGCSAGANIAAAVCLYAKEKGGPSIDKQILMYPFLDIYTDPDSKGSGSLGGPIMYVFNELYCTTEEAKLPLASPVYASTDELKDLPEAIIVYAENDSLRAEGMKYAEMLRNAAVKVTDITSMGMPHGFYESGFGEVFEGENDYLGEEIRIMIMDGTISKKSQECLEFIKKNYTGR